MKKTKLSRSEELARISLEETEVFLEEKLDAQHERAQRTANLKALRLEQEAKQKKAASRLAKVINNK